MTIPHFTQEQLIKHLAQYGWNEISNKDWETHKRIMISDGKTIITFQLRKLYSFLHTVVLCKSLGIPSDPEHQECYDQIQELNRRKRDEPEPGEE